MTHPLPGTRRGALQIWPDGDQWRYLPAHPTPQRDATGRAQLTAIEAGGMLMLTLGTALTADEAQLAQTRAAIAGEQGRPAHDIELRPADAHPDGAVLTFTPADGAAVELARARPSPVPPYPAAFSVVLRDAQATLVNAALKQGSGRLDVRYDMTIAATVAVTARIVGATVGHAAGAEEPRDSAKDGSDAGTGTGVGDAAARDGAARAAILAALEAGDLVLSLEADPDASDALRSEARQQVLDAAAATLARLVGTGQPTGRPPPAQPDERDRRSPAPTSGRCSDGPLDAVPPSAGAGNAGSGIDEANAPIRIDAEVTRTAPAPIPARLVANVADWL